MAQSKHEIIERNVFLLIVLTLLAVSVGGLVEIVPLFFQKSTTQAVDHEGNPLVKTVDGKEVQLVTPYSALEFAGRDVYIREGCYNCHSQMIRPFKAETERYGHFSVAGEFIYDHPFQWGSKRTGPDLARVGKRYTDVWQKKHLEDPRSVVPESNMPAFTWLRRPIDAGELKARMGAQNMTLGPTPYTTADIDGAPAAVADKTELDALVAYLQKLGTALR